MKIKVLYFYIEFKIGNEYIFDTENKNFDILALVRLSVIFDHSLSFSWTQNSGENIFLHHQFITIAQFTQDWGDPIF